MRSVTVVRCLMSDLNSLRVLELMYSFEKRLSIAHILLIGSNFSYVDLGVAMYSIDGCRRDCLFSLKRMS